MKRIAFTYYWTERALECGLAGVWIVAGALLQPSWAVASAALAWIVRAVDLLDPNLNHTTLACYALFGPHAAVHTRSGYAQVHPLLTIAVRRTWLVPGGFAADVTLCTALAALRLSLGVVRDGDVSKGMSHTGCWQPPLAFGRQKTVKVT